MNKKILGYVGIGVVVLLVLIGVVVGFSFSSSEEVVDGVSGLEQYRTEDIPSDCRLPIYEDSVESWKEHLSHHGNTLYCLEYFE